MKDGTGKQSVRRQKKESNEIAGIEADEQERREGH